jgi:ankyrin repeat protein
LLHSTYQQEKDRNPSRVPGTCEWFLHHPKFEDWRDKSTDILLVFADPGCGKSVLAKTLVDEKLCSTGTNRSTTCYFFFKDGEAHRKGCVAALRALLHGIFGQQPQLVKYALTHFVAKGEDFQTDPDLLWQILLAATADPETGEVICILDALDEAEASEREILTQLLGDFYSPRGQTTKLKFLITSRPYSSIDRSFRRHIPDISQILLDGQKESEHISSEINYVIEHEVPRISSTFRYPLKPNVQKDLIQHLKAVEHRTYLWLHLIFDVIRSTQESTTRRMKNEIDRLPDTVDAAYERLLSRADGAARSQTMNIFHIILGATRLLTPKELRIALRIKDNIDDGEIPHSPEDLDLEDDGPFEEFIRNRCGLLVTVVDNTVYFLHQTVREFLVSKNDRDSSNILESQKWLWKHTIVLRESDFVLAKVCTIYLLFENFKNRPLLLPSTNDGNSYLAPHWTLKRNQLDVISEYMSAHPFLSYASDNWPRHFKWCSIDRQEEMSQSFLQLCNTESRRFQTWIAASEKDSRYDEDLSDAGIAYFVGLEEGLRDLVEAGASAASLNPVLRMAARDGKIDIVGFLILNGADVNRTNKYGWTALMIAASRGHEAIVELLLFEGADPNTSNIHGETALTESASQGYGSIVKILLLNGADIHAARDGRALAALDIAAGQGHADVVQLLLSYEADTNSFGAQERPGLILAAAAGDVDIVQLLISGRADINISDESGVTALMAAASSGHPETVRLLLLYRAIVNRIDVNGETALIGATRPLVMELLLLNGANVNNVDKAGRTALHHIIERGAQWIGCFRERDLDFYKMVRILLNGGMDPRTADTEGRTPLQLFDELLQDGGTAPEKRNENVEYRAKGDDEVRYDYKMCMEVLKEIRCLITTALQESEAKVLVGKRKLSMVEDSQATSELLCRYVGLILDSIVTMLMILPR